MKFDTHGNGNGLDDLYVLPETTEEFKALQRYAAAALIQQRMGNYSAPHCKWFAASGDWAGRLALEIAFGASLRSEIESLSCPRRTTDCNAQDLTFRR